MRGDWALRMERSWSPGREDIRTGLGVGKRLEKRSLVRVSPLIFLLAGNIQATV
jgi:hypothetical protein